jgi:hypothetical protein
MATGAGDGRLNMFDPLKVRPPINTSKIRKLRLAILASNHIPIFRYFLRRGFIFLISATHAGVMP